LYDLLIIGSGPAGLTAAIYSSRNGLKTCVIAGTLWGGQLMLTTDVENYPGFKEGIQGPDLMNEMWKQAERFGAKIIFEDATSIDFSSKPFKIRTSNEIYNAKSVIIATGAYAKKLGLESEDRLWGKGVSVCATCDAAFFRDKNVMVIGGGDTAAEEALVLSRFAKNVSIVHRRDKLRAAKILQKKIFDNPKIKIIWNSIVKEILGKEKVEGVKLKKVNLNEEFNLPCDAVFLAIGHKPNTEIFKEQIHLDEYGYIVVKDHTKTNVNGIFVAGDAQDYLYRQAITAAGSGCKAAIDADRYLQNL
jgi:thioredoxin reductase (NADPH)